MAQKQRSRATIEGQSEPTTKGLRRRGTMSKGDQREAQILDATRQLLTKKPMANLTVDDITNATGISRTSFYFYFPSKQAVLARLMEDVSDRYAQTHVWLPSTGPQRELLRAQLAGAAEVWHDNSAILVCSLEGYDSGYPPLVEFIATSATRFTNALAAKIERDRAAGLAPEGIAPATLAALVALMRDGRLSQLAAATPDEVATGLDDLTEAILRLIYGRLD
ncbi:TetR/AcrR family transcriptional regulator [Nocardia seriolae]|uniref:TetR family transcriptional regulator n=1 Tax=Nocardia seriolae TaxID=37332 RepID=A0A0B8N408_9NOCA|nr:TetR/AcrR family transcriptional regulator [Nocardia seriolae]MTJ63293.1 TetR family transcriptional regulator [Nocardia seriolae]MTJ71168.1 TetR family transcriptional regulator [Nocardia seriolae]MTJ88907.1 TetR family transcriptional regulator [Nocardia seriolae]MTK32886.1 TetR family transcriptional regulator [Nocardia seriolae]MTK41184.1 TetR family transcriptional regulator [Nocardia seriolae]